MRARDLVSWKDQESGRLQALADLEPTFALFSKEMNRLFDDCFRVGSNLSPIREGARFVPKVNVVDSPGEVTVTAELPGMTESEIDISLSRDSLVLKGERKKEETKTKDSITYHESSFGSFERVIPLGVGVDEEKVEARMRDGVLTIKLPKTAQQQKQVRKVSIKRA